MLGTTNIKLYPVVVCVFFYSDNLNISIVKVFFYSPTDTQVNCLKPVLKFTLKQLRHVSVQSHHHQGAHYLCLLKLQLLSTSNALPDDGVTAPKHVGAVNFNVNFKIIFKTIHLCIS